MSEQMVDKEFEAFFARDASEVSDSELWRWTPRLLEEVARGWGQPLTERISAARWLLMMAGLTPGDVVQAVLVLRAEARQARSPARAELDDLLRRIREE